MAIRVDPRLRARRVAVRRAQGRRRLRVLLVVVGLIALGVGAWALSRSPLLDLDRVRVDTALANTVSADRLAAVEAAVGLEFGTPLFGLDLDAVEAAVGALPWIASVDVSREWLGTVRVTIEPRVAVAVVGTLEGNRLLIDAEGVLTGEAPVGTELPVIAIEPSVALGGIQSNAIAALAVAAAIPDDLLLWVDAVTVAPGPGAAERPVVGLDLVGSATVEMGSAELIDDKLAAVRAILESTSLACIDVIDVVVADLTTVTRDPLCDGQAMAAGSGEEG